MSREQKLAYWRCYYRKHRERIIASISENRRKRKRENRARLTELGLLPLPPEYFAAAQKRARQGQTLRRIYNLPDVYSEEEGSPQAEGSGVRPAAPVDDGAGD